MWSIVGAIAPITTLSREQLLGRSRPAPTVPRRLPQVELVGEPVLFRQFPDLAITRCRMPKRQNGVALLESSGELVGVAAPTFEFIAERHRGRKIAPELLAELYTAVPAILITRTCELRPRLRFYSPGGERALLRAYELLVERKAVLPKP